MLNDPNNQIVDGTFALLQIHTGADGLPSWGARATFYGFTATPSAVFDGMLFYIGTETDVQAQFNVYLDAYNQRRAVPTDVTINSTGVETNPTTHTYSVNALVCVEPGGAEKYVRVYMAQVLDHYGCSYCRYTFMQAATTQDVLLSPGECAVVSRSFTLNSTSWANKTNVKFVIWAQEVQASGPPSNPAEIFQVHVMSWPFLGPDCNFNGVVDSEDIANGTSADCNLNGVPDECDIWSGTSDDENTNGIPDECEEVITGDVNCDGAVNFGDINPFVMMMMSVPQWHLTYPDCLARSGDCNHDGAINFGDINPFVAILSGL
jgi:hypothetical protein